MRGVAGLALTLVAVSGAAQAQETAPEALARAGRAYEDGRLLAAAQAAEEAVALIRARLVEELLPALPPAPAGWQALEPQAPGAGQLGAGQTIVRPYARGEARMAATLLLDSTAAEAVAAILAEPSGVTSQPNLERTEIDGRAALLEWSGESRAGRVMVPLGERSMAQVSGEGVDSAEVLLALMRAWRLDSVEERLR